VEPTGFAVIVKLSEVSPVTGPPGSPVNHRKDYDHVTNNPNNIQHHGDLSGKEIRCRHPKRMVKIPKSAFEHLGFKFAH